MIDYIKRAFYEPNWKLAIRKIHNNEFNNIKNNNIEYNLIVSDKDCWYADPFLISKGGSIYIFCECYLIKKRKGVIAAGEYKNGKVEDMRIIIEQDYHMSYPCVFEYGSQYYMIPETADNKTIDLYRARKFPYEWELSKTLLKNINCVDSTVIITEDDVFIIGYRLGKCNRICIFHFDIINETLQFLDEQEDSSGRPAGNIIFVNNKLIRPVQMSKKKYGESIIFKEITSIKDYHEEPLLYLEGKDILVKGEKKVDRIHTFNRIQNIEIIDYSCDSFKLLRPGKIFLRRLRLYINK